VATILKQLLIASLLLLALGIVVTPSAGAYPNCEVQNNVIGIGVVCAGGPKPLGLCTLDIYDTPYTIWCCPGEYVCV